MGFEYKIQMTGADQLGISDCLRNQPAFLYEEGGVIHLGPSSEEIQFTIKEEDHHVYVCQHVATKDTDALLGLLIRRILSLKDHVVISEP